MEDIGPFTTPKKDSLEENVKKSSISVKRVFAGAYVAGGVGLTIMQGAIGFIDYHADRYTDSLSVGAALVSYIGAGVLAHTIHSLYKERT